MSLSLLMSTHDVSRKSKVISMTHLVNPIISNDILAKLSVECAKVPIELFDVELSDERCPIDDLELGCGED